MSLKCSNRRYRHRYNLIGFLQQFRQPSLCHKPGLSRDGKRKEHGAKGKNRDFSLHDFSCLDPLVTRPSSHLMTLIRPIKVPTGKSLARCAEESFTH